MKNFIRANSGIFLISKIFITVSVCLGIFSGYTYGQKLILNDLEYFETPGGKYICLQQSIQRDVFR